jgi:hypothetical protein
MQENKNGARAVGYPAVPSPVKSNRALLRLISTSRAY